jgi:HSP90 family molecular chaperone
MALTNINKVRDAEMIANKIFDVILLSDIEKEMVSKMLNEWNDEWIDFVAENETGRTDNTEQARRRDNQKRLQDRINKLGGIKPKGDSRPAMLDDPGF